MPNPIIDDGPQGLDWIVSTTADLDLVLTIEEETSPGVWEPYEWPVGTEFAAVAVAPSNVDQPLAEMPVATSTGQITVSLAAASNDLPEGDLLWSLWQTAPTRTPFVEGALTVARALIGA